ncbi:MAG: hypothetical protein KF833_14365 [Verrucomicrobiae bacterium]|nr:hypothetical protein [Verrucomicrobiae bacterium]
MSGDVARRPVGAGSMRGNEVRRVLAEGLAVGALGIGFALLANYGSPKGLDLRRDYFPPVTAAVPATLAVADGSHEQGRGSVGRLEARLRQRGLESADREQVRQWFEDPRYLSEGIVFLDARREGAYRAGHIPGAYLFDHYRPEPYLPEVLPACQFAEIVVVYCSGGECEDSEFAAVLLREMGVPGERLRVYLGGIEEWSAHGLPVETGPRHSGELR